MRHAYLILGFATGMVLSSRPASAQTYDSWTNTAGGLWQTPANWSAGAPANTFAGLFITNAIYKTVSLYSPAPASTLTISNLTVAGPSGTTNTLAVGVSGSLTTGTFDILNGLTINSGGAFVEGNGANIVTTRVDGVSGGTFSVDGTVALNGGSFIITNTSYIGYNGTGQLTVNGGYLNGGYIYLGYSNTACGTVTISKGVINNVQSWIGYASGANSNIILVAGSGSVWSNLYALYIGSSSSGNSLTISNGGAVYNSYGYIGTYTGANSNTVLVTGPGSVWNSGTDTYVGENGSGNSLVISNGGTVYVSYYASIGESSSASNNVVLVTGSGSVWTNIDQLYVGTRGFGNSLTIANSGTVYAASGLIGGAGSRANSNTVLVTGPGSVWTNTSHIEVGHSSCGNSLIVSNGGTVHDTFGFIGYNNPSSNNAALVTGHGSVWGNGGWYYSQSPDFFVGFWGSSNSLTVANSGTVFNANGWIGYFASASNNVVLVTGSGSVWSNNGAAYGYGSDLYVGNAGHGNSLVISNGGTVLNANGWIGYTNGANNNAVLVTGSGSVWSNGLDLSVGVYGSGQSLVISNSGRVVNRTGYVGNNSDNNIVRVADAAVWQSGGLVVGDSGSSNSIIVAGGTVLSTNLVVGLASATCDNLVELDSGSLYVTNATHSAVLEVRNGSFIQNGGMVQADILVITNACARFIRNGGALIVGSLLLDPNLSAVGDGIANGWKQQYALDPFDPNLANEDPDGDGMSNLQEFQAGTDPTNSASAFRITDIAQEGDDIRVTWTMGSGKTNALQGTAGDVDGGYTNTFTDLFIVTNTVGNVTNYLDVGAATNLPSRYYRVRLVP